MQIISPWLAYLTVFISNKEMFLLFVKWYPQHGEDKSNVKKCKEMMSLKLDNLKS